MRTDILPALQSGSSNQGGTGRKWEESCSPETRQAAGRPGARQRAAEEETAVIEAVISIGSRQRRHQARHRAGESISQAAKPEGHDESESPQHDDP